MFSHCSEEIYDGHEVDLDMLLGSDAASTENNYIPTEF